MVDREQSAPQEDGEAADFVARLRQLKHQSGLSYRQLEERASSLGEVLPRSTVADMLGNDTLPRAETLMAFLRVCGEAQNAEAWLDARRRLAASAAARAQRVRRDAAPGPGQAQSGDAPRLDAESGSAETPQAPGEQRTPTPEAGRSRPAVRPRALSLSVSRKQLGSAALSLIVLVFGGYLALAEVQRDDEGRETVLPPPGTYRIRSVVSSLCLSERDGDDAGYVYQSDCGKSVPTYALEEAGDGAYRIRSLHPVFGYGCLGVDNGSTQQGARMMDDYCGHRGTSERFRVDPVGKQGYRIVPLHTNACVSVPGDSAKTWTPLLQLSCAPGTAGQIFRFDPVPSPSAVPTISSNE